MSSAPTPAIAGLFTYPVKSLQGHSHATRALTTEGLVGDREWIIVDRNSVFYTQRQNPVLASIRAVPRDTNSIALEHDTCGAVSGIVNPNLTRTIRVWDDTVPAHDAGDDAARWLSALLNAEVRLLRYADPHTRLSSRRWAGDSGAHTRFADGFSVLVTNEASLDELNTRMGRTLPMDRFRPNVVVRGIEAWDEDHIDTITCGDVVLKLVKPCVRCITTTTDQANGQRTSDEPLSTLGRFRNNPDMGGVTFGVNAIVVHGGALSVGDAAHIEYRF
jgi:uncharacterized protein